MGNLRRACVLARTRPMAFDHDAADRDEITEPTLRSRECRARGEESARGKMIGQAMQPIPYWSTPPRPPGPSRPQARTTPGGRQCYRPDWSE